MQLDIPRQDVDRLLEMQLRSLFLLERAEELVLVRSVVDEALIRSERCFARVANKYYRRDGAVVFNPFHGAQYAVFLYHVGRVLWERDPGNRLVADRVYGLNRALHGVDMFYEVEMPPVFACDHPLGSIIGRARIGSCFFFTQHCTVGNNKGIYPVIGNHVTMLPGSTILGNCAIGDHVVMAAQSYVRDRDIPAHSLVFGQERNIVIKPITPGSEVQYWLAGGDE